ncbi:MAG: hypothetical protein LBG93_02960 [Treponema sp.]|jgi:hypothetical protein|nr:hypothetical protein [Treponema sp.]
MIKAAKDVLERVIKGQFPDMPVVRSAVNESHTIMARKFPLVSLITNPGTFDGTVARIVRYLDNDGTYKERFVRGERVVPILVRCWAEGEEEADEIFSRIIPVIPSQWEYEGFATHIEIRAEEHSDHAGNTGKMYLSVAEVSFRAVAAVDPKKAPFIERAVLQGGEFIRKE